MSKSLPLTSSLTSSINGNNNGRDGGDEVNRINHRYTNNNNYAAIPPLSPQLNVTSVNMNGRNRSLDIGNLPNVMVFPTSTTTITRNINVNEDIYGSSGNDNSYSESEINEDYDDNDDFNAILDGEIEYGYSTDSKIASSYEDNVNSFSQSPSHSNRRSSKHYRDKINYVRRRSKQSDIHSTSFGSDHNGHSFSSYEINDSIYGLCYVNSLPDNILLKIFSYLDPIQLSTIEYCCKKWFKLISTDECWLLSYIHYFGLPPSLAGLDENSHISPFQKSMSLYNGYKLSKRICVNGTWRQEIQAQRDYSRTYRKVLQTSLTSGDENETDYDNLFIFGLDSWEKQQQKLIVDPDLDSYMSGRYTSRKGNSGVLTIQDIDENLPSMSKLQRTHQSYEKKDPWALMIKFEEASFTFCEPFTKRKPITRSLAVTLPISPITACKKYENTTDLTNPILITGFANGTCTLTKNLLSFNGPKIIEMTQCHRRNSAVQQVAFINNRTNDSLVLSAAGDGSVFIYDSRTGSPLAMLSTSLSDVFGVPLEYQDRCFPGEFVSLETIDYELEQDNDEVIIATTITAVKSTGIIITWKIEEKIENNESNNITHATLLPEDMKSLKIIKKKWVGTIKRTMNTVFGDNKKSDSNIAFSNQNNYGMPQSLIDKLVDDKSDISSNSLSLIVDECPEVSASFYFNYSKGSSNNILNLIGSDTAFLVTNSRIYLIYFDNWFEHGISKIKNRDNLLKAKDLNLMIIGGVLTLTPIFYNNQLISSCSWERQRKQVRLISSDGSYNTKLGRESIRNGISTPPVVFTNKRITTSTLVTGHMNGTFTIWDLPNGIPGSADLLEAYAKTQSIKTKLSNDKLVSNENKLNLNEFASSFIDINGIQYQLLSGFEYIRPRMVSSKPEFYSLSSSNEKLNSNSLLSPSENPFDTFNSVNYSSSMEDSRHFSNPHRKTSYLSKSQFYQGNSPKCISKREHNAASLTATVCGNTSPVVATYVDNFKIIISHLDGDVSIWRLIDGILLNKMAKSGKRFRSASAFNANILNNRNNQHQSIWRSHNANVGRVGGGLGNDFTTDNWDDGTALGPWSTSSVALAVFQQMSSIPVPLRCIIADETTVYGLRDKASVRVKFGKDVSKYTKRLIEREKRTLALSNTFNNSLSNSTATSISNTPIGSNNNSALQSPVGVLNNILIQDGENNGGSSSTPNFNPDNSRQVSSLTQRLLAAENYNRNLAIASLNSSNGTNNGGNGNSASQEFHLQREMKYNIKQALNMRDEEDYKHVQDEIREEKMLRRYNGKEFMDLKDLTEEEMIQYVTMLSIQETSSTVNSQIEVSNNENQEIPLLKEQQEIILNNLSNDKNISNETTLIIEKNIINNETNFPSLSSIISKPLKSIKEKSNNSEVLEEEDLKHYNGIAMDKSLSQPKPKKGKKGKTAILLDLAYDTPKESQREQEDLDYAIALSLAESDLRK